jgi:ribosomal protein S21
MGKPVYVEVSARTRHLDENERLIRAFVKKTKKSGIIELVKSKQFYEKPSVARRRKKLSKLKSSRQSTAKKKK